MKNRTRQTLGAMTHKRSEKRSVGPSPICAVGSWLLVMLGLSQFMLVGSAVGQGLEETKPWRPEKVDEFRATAHKRTFSRVVIREMQNAGETLQVEILRSATPGVHISGPATGRPVFDEELRKDMVLVQEAKGSGFRLHLGFQPKPPFSHFEVEARGAFYIHPLWRGSSMPALHFGPEPWLYDGAETIISGTVMLFGQKIVSDSDYPLTLKVEIEAERPVEKEGEKWMFFFNLIRLCGRGTVITREGKTRRFGYEDTVDTWLPRLTSTYQLLREGAAQALGWLAKTVWEKDRVVVALIGALQDSAMEVRRNAAESLGRLVDPRAVEPLASLTNPANEKDDRVRAVVEEALDMIKRK